jgi:hypothetical protein
MKRLLAVVMSLVSVCAMADNERGFYVGVGMAEFMYDDETIDVSNARTAEILGGYKYNAALGVEIRYGTGVSEGKSKNDATAGRLKREIDSYYAVYYKPELSTTKPNFICCWDTWTWMRRKPCMHLTAQKRCRLIFHSQAHPTVLVSALSLMNVLTSTWSTGPCRNTAIPKPKLSALILITGSNRKTGLAQPRFLFSE